jgi:hypothetical protein
MYSPFWRIVAHAIERSVNETYSQILLLFSQNHQGAVREPFDKYTGFFVGRDRAVV